jgi:hypothetical protein
MKTKLSILLMGMAFCYSSQLTAQFQNFDLSKYRVADYQRKQLDFNFSLSGNFQNYGSVNGSSTNDKYSSFGSYLQASYNGVTNSRKIQSNTSFAATLNPYYSNSSQNGDNSKNKNSYSSLNYSTSTRFYKPNLFFCEIGLNSNLNAIYNYYNTVYQGITSTTESKNMAIALGIPLFIGKGRIENVEDARMAVYILEDMQKNGTLASIPAEDEVIRFSEKITQLKNKRFFDIRLRRIYEIQAIDSFLRERNLIKGNDAVYFTSLLDNWQYSNNPVRQSGKRFSLGITPSFNYSGNSNSNSLPQKSTNKYGSVDVTARYLVNKPVSLNFQRDYGFEVGYLNNSYTANHMAPNIPDGLEKNNQFHLSSFLDYGFYPNSRSFHQLKFTGSAQRYWIAQPDYRFIRNLNSVSLETGISGYFYFSQRLRLNYNLSGRYFPTGTYYTTYTTKSRNFDGYFSVYFTYSLF